jgi:hypothetical protein
MKAKDWIYIIAAVAAFVLGALLFRGCQKPAQTVEVVKWRTVNLDSLKATMPRDTVIIPGPARQVVRYVPVTITDQAQADSLMQVYAELAKRYAVLQDELGWVWDAGDGNPIEWGQDETVYADSVTTKDYFHRWEIRATGSITGYKFGVLPFCPELVAPPAEVKKLHRAGLFAGGQTMPGGLRPILGASYGFGVIRLQAGFLPAAYGEKAQCMVLTGVEIPFK